MANEMFNAEAEALTLASIIRYPESYWAINDMGLVPDDFLGADNRKVFKAIQQVVQERKQPDMAFIIEEMQLAGEDTEYVTRLAQQPASSAQGREYATIVKGLATNRRLANAGAKIIEVARELRTDYDTAFAEAEAALRAVRETLPVSERSPDPADIIYRLRSNTEQRSIPIRFLPTLQQYTGGFQPGHFWVVGGFSSIGKSAVACNFVLDALRQRKWVGVMSLEMPQEVYMLRLLSIASGVPQRALREKAVLPIAGEGSIEALEKAERGLSRSPLRIYDNVYELDSIRSTAKRMKETEGLDLLVVDFLQNISVKGKDEWAAARESSLEFQRMAKDLDCTVLAMSQVSNEQAKAADSGTAGSYYSFKGHGGIRDAADVGIMLKRDQRNNSPILTLDVVKNRHDEKGPIDTMMYLQTGRIEEI